MSQVDVVIAPYNCSPPKSSSQVSSVMTQPLLSRDNPIQLAAISNYKLAQLTFSAPDLNSMRKTALIKNMTEVIYNDTPPEWLDQMRRWQFFTPESLNDMTQGGLEQIFAQYIQIMEAFRPIHLNEEDEDDDEEDDDDDEDLWADEEVLTPSDHPFDLGANLSSRSTALPAVLENTLYSNSGASLSADLLYSKEFKPLPDRPVLSSTASPSSLPPTMLTSSATTTMTTASAVTTTGTTTTTTSATITTDSASLLNSSPADDKQRRKSIAKMRNRLSWTSDTGLSANSAVAQTWANELMTMFNMEFQVDTSLTLNTAPKLPELPFSSRHSQQQKRKSRKSQRYSTDSFMNLIPAFETFDLEEIVDRRSALSNNRSRNIIFPPPPLSSPPHDTSSSFTSSRRRSSSQPVPMDTYQRAESKPGPARSSSLKYKSHSSTKSQDMPPIAKKSTDILNGLVNAFSGEKSLSKKKSIRRLAALVTGSNTHLHHNHQSSPTASPSPSPSPSPSNNSLAYNNGRRSSPSASAHISPFPTSIYQPPSVSPTHRLSQPEDSNNYLSVNSSDNNNNSRLSIVSTSTTSSTNSTVMVAVKTPLLQHKPLPDTPSQTTFSNSTAAAATAAFTATSRRRTSYTMARPVVVELSELRRSRSLGYRPKKKRKSLRAASSMKRKSGNKPPSSSSPPSLSSSSSSSSSPPPSSSSSPSSSLSSSPSTVSLSTSSSPNSSTPLEHISIKGNQEATQYIPPLPSSSAVQAPATSLPASSSLPSLTAGLHSPIQSSDIASSTSLNEQLLTTSVGLSPSSTLSAPQPKRSKSAFMKLSTGLTKGQKKTSRKNSASSSSSFAPDMESELTEANFVKRMASLGKRMKLQRV